MRPKTKNTNIFHAQTTKNTKNKTTKKKKQTTTTKQTFIIIAFYIAFASTIQFSHNTPPHTQHPTTCGPNTWAATSKKVLLTRGDP